MRQARLVGHEAQARIERATIAVRSTGLAAIVEEAYLKGAGAHVEHAPDGCALHSFEIENAAAASVALGAYNALVSIRRIVRA